MTRSFVLHTLSDLSVLPGYNEALAARAPSALAKALLLAILEEDGGVRLTPADVSVLEFRMIDILQQAHPDLFTNRANADVLREAFHRAVDYLKPLLTPTGGVTLSDHKPLERALTDHFREGMRAVHDAEHPFTDFNVVVELDTHSQELVRKLAVHKHVSGNQCVLASKPSKYSYRLHLVDLVGQQVELRATRLVEDALACVLRVKFQPCLEVHPHVLVSYADNPSYADNLLSEGARGTEVSLLLQGMIKIVPGVTP